MTTALIVEDSLTDRTLLTHHLEQLGVQVSSVGSSEEAIASTKVTSPDLVFLDVILPRQSGFEFCRDLKTDQRTQHILIVICSSKGTEGRQALGFYARRRYLSSQTR